MEVVLLSAGVFFAYVELLRVLLMLILLRKVHKHQVLLGYLHVYACFVQIFAIVIRLTARFDPSMEVLVIQTLKLCLSINIFVFIVSEHIVRMNGYMLRSLLRVNRILAHFNA